MARTAASPSTADSEVFARGAVPDSLVPRRIPLMMRASTIVMGLIGVLSTCSWGDEAKPAGHGAAGALVRSSASGPWSEPATWEGGQVPKAGSRVQVRTGHTVTYDVSSAEVIRSIHVAGTLR